MNNPKAVVRNWFIAGFDGKNQTSRGEEIKEKDSRLYGKTYGHEEYDPITSEFQDGHRIITSPVVEVDWETLMVRTESGSVYKLEGPESNIDAFWNRTSPTDL